ncbi:Hypothetical protein, putative [Bodo saltans]|uniref:Uncharacterized protein n=1 Tax=Bodo saltans TaxID=75058 RepID=A0A0S4IZC8_BODSA|nr:Hypothetical protein, putative [Bodo saltans]|eukprot:CUG07441.1 Hypothetical protein, putative [Bodo saltans]
MESKLFHAGHQGEEDGRDEERLSGASEGCSQTNTPGSTNGNQITPPSVAVSTPGMMSFNALAAPFVPATAALGPLKPTSTDGSTAHEGSPVSASTATQRFFFPVRRWYCQVVGPVFLKPLDEDQWKEELERMTQVHVSAVAVNPTDGLRACITLSSTSESLALYNGRNMISKNGTWTLIAERLVPIILTDTTTATASHGDGSSEAKVWDHSRAALQQLSSIMGCDVFPHEGDDDLSTDARRLVVDVREGDAAYALEWDGGLARSAQHGGGIVIGDSVRVERAVRAAPTLPAA